MAPQLHTPEERLLFFFNDSMGVCVRGRGLGVQFWDPLNKDYGILGFIFGYPNLAKLPCVLPGRRLGDSGVHWE